MRLLERPDDGGYNLTPNLLDDDIPRYAILSHTWRQRELTFEDVVAGSCRDKEGYDKISFCGRQARKDRLRYFWVDSCCIKKSSDAELSEALNSMFRWYLRAEKCYVYLSDVSIDEPDINVALRKSKWFTRGWTLQELLAPATVEFYSKEGKKLGDKKSLERQIHDITGIPIEALQGRPLSQFSISERMSWTSNRKTSRREDEAYCLFGIFDVFMSPIYGEGRENALRRLQGEINKRTRTPNVPSSPGTSKLLQSFLDPL